MNGADAMPSPSLPLAAEPERDRVLAWMHAEIADGSYRDSAGEPEYTQLAEAAADRFDRDAWLDDELHPVWDWAIEAFDRG